MSIFFKSLPDVRDRMKWDTVMKTIFRMQPDNDSQYLAFQVFLTTIITLFFIWLVLMTQMFFFSIGKDALSISTYFLRFWFIAGSVINFVILPYYILKTIKVLGFNKYDFLEASRFRRWERKKIISLYRIWVVVFIFALQFGGEIIGNKILNRYEIESLYGYCILSIITATFIALTTMLIYFIILIFFQYKYYFEQIPNSEFQPQNNEGNVS